MSRDEQRVNGSELKPLTHRAARHRLDPFVGQPTHSGWSFPIHEVTNTVDSHERQDEVRQIARSKHRPCQY